jgi:hypothetical protein
VADPDLRVTRRADGAYELNLSADERDLLRSLPEQLRMLLRSDNPAVERLFPPAYADDPARESEYRGMVGDQLRDERLSALEVMERTIDAPRLDEDELSSWLSAINDLRLVLGSRLEVTEEMYEEGIPEDDPRAPAWAVYQYLGFLESHVIDALAQGLPGDPRSR